MGAAASVPEHDAATQDVVITKKRLSIISRGSSPTNSIRSSMKRHLQTELPLTLTASASMSSSPSSTGTSISPSSADTSTTGGNSKKQERRKKRFGKRFKKLLKRHRKRGSSSTVGDITQVPSLETATTSKSSISANTSVAVVDAWTGQVDEDDVVSVVSMTESIGSFGGRSLLSSQPAVVIEAPSTVILNPPETGDLEEEKEEELLVSDDQWKNQVPPPPPLETQQSSVSQQSVSQQSYCQQSVCQQSEAPSDCSHAQYACDDSMEVLVDDFLEVIGGVNKHGNESIISGRVVDTLPSQDILSLNKKELSVTGSSVAVGGGESLACDSFEGSQATVPKELNILTPLYTPPAIDTSSPCCFSYNEFDEEAGEAAGHNRLDDIAETPDGLMTRNGSKISKVNTFAMLALAVVIAALLVYMDSTVLISSSIAGPLLGLEIKRQASIASKDKSKLNSLKSWSPRNWLKTPTNFLKTPTNVLKSPTWSPKKFFSDSKDFFL